MTASPSDKVWACRDGRTIPISEMEDTHLLNSVRMMRRNGFVGLRTLRCYLGEGPSGDGAAMAFEAEQDDAFSRKPSLVMDWLEEEAERRGLDLRN